VGNIGSMVLLICFFCGVTLFFSVNSASLRVFSHSKLKHIFKTANNRGKHSLSPEEFGVFFENNSERFILTCSFYRLIFNIVIVLLLVAVFEAASGGRLEALDYLWILLIAALLFSIFSLAIPHAWAKYGGEQILIRTYRLLIFLAWLSCPALYVFNLYDGFVKRLAGVVEGTPEELQEEKQQDFLTGLEQHKMEGVVDEEEQEMIENVLELDEKNAEEVMTPRTEITAVEVSSDLETVLKIIAKAGHTRVPVYEGDIDNIIGFVYAKDLLAEIGKDTEQFRLRDKLREPYRVPETKSLRSLLHEFQNRKLHIAVLLDEYGGTAGVVTLEDILEELVGEIEDEYEEPESVAVLKVDSNTIEVDARIYIDELNDQLSSCFENQTANTNIDEFVLPASDDYDTVGGFVLSHLGYIPKTGQTFNYSGFRFTITSAEARRIKRLRIQLI